MVKYLIIIIVFLVLLYLASRYLVRMRTLGKKGDIRIVDSLRLGPDSFIYILETMNKRYLIAQNKNAITLLDRESDFGEIFKEACSAEPEDKTEAQSCRQSQF